MGGTKSTNMLRVLFCLASVSLAVYAAPTSELSASEYEYLFKAFQTDHAKTYAEHETQAKFRVFKDNVDFINDHNKNHADSLGYTVGINQFADMTKTEYKRTMLGYNALRKPTNLVTEKLDETAAPASVDWTTKGAVTPVKDQGACGSCWAFSTTGSVEGRNQIKNGKLVSLSEQELMSCASKYGNNGCNGGLMDDGFKFIEAEGLDLESSYQYQHVTGSCNNVRRDLHDGINPGVVTSFKDVAANSQTQLMAAVAEGPVSVAIEADQSGFGFYKSGVFSGTCGTNLDHGVLVVGYGTDGGKDYWKVKNSWGATWGDAGYIKMVKTASGAGICGIAAQASYPVIGGSEDVALSVFRKSLESQFGAWTASAPPPADTASKCQSYKCHGPPTAIGQYCENDLDCDAASKCHGPPDAIGQPCADDSDCDPGAPKCSLCGKDVRDCCPTYGAPGRCV